MTQHRDWSISPVAGPIYRPQECATYLGISISSFYELISRGELPPLLKLTQRGRASGLPKSWLDIVLADHAAQATQSLS